MSADEKVQTLQTLIDRANEDVDQGGGVVWALDDADMKQLRALATQQAQPPTAQRQDDKKRFLSVFEDWTSAEWNMLFAYLPDLKSRLIKALEVHGAGAAVEAVAADCAIVPRYSGDFDNAVKDMVMSFDYDSVASNEYDAFDEMWHGLVNMVEVKPQQRSEQGGDAFDAANAAGFIAACDYGVPNADLVEAIVRAALSTQPLPQPAGVSKGVVEDEDGMPVGYARWYNNRFRGRTVDTQRDHDCEEAWRAALHPNQAKNGDVS